VPELGQYETERKKTSEDKNQKMILKMKENKTKRAQVQRELEWAKVHHKGVLSQITFSDMCDVLFLHLLS
jgi:uncharacterized membrane protein (DUF106 family)